MMGEKGECSLGRSQVSKGCHVGGKLSKCICVRSKSMGECSLSARDHAFQHDKGCINEVMGGF